MDMIASHTISPADMTRYISLAASQKGAPDGTLRVKGPLPHVDKGQILAGSFCPEEQIINQVDEETESDGPNAPTIHDLND